MTGKVDLEVVFLVSWWCWSKLVQLPGCSELQEGLCPVSSLHGSTLPPRPPLTTAQVKAKTLFLPAVSLPMFGVTMSPAHPAYETPPPLEGPTGSWVMEMIFQVTDGKAPHCHPQILWSPPSLFSSWDYYFQ